MPLSCVCVGGVMCMEGSAQKPEENVKCPVVLLSTLFHETGSLTDLELAWRPPIATLFFLFFTLQPYLALF